MRGKIFFLNATYRPSKSRVYTTERELNPGPCKFIPGQHRCLFLLLLPPPGSSVRALSPSPSATTTPGLLLAQVAAAYARCPSFLRTLRRRRAPPGRPDPLVFPSCIAAPSTQTLTSYFVFGSGLITYACIMPANFDCFAKIIAPSPPGWNSISFRQYHGLLEFRVKLQKRILWELRNLPLC